MKKISVSELKPGMTFTKPVYLDPDNMLVQAEEPVTASDIDRLQKWNIKEVETSGELIEMTEEEMNAPTALPGTSQAVSAEETKEIDRIKSELKKTILLKNEFIQLLEDGQTLLKECYQSITDERPFQISRVRQLAENLSSNLDRCPNGFFYTYYDNSDVSLYHHVMVAAIYGGILGNALNQSKPKVIELIFSMLLMKIGMVKVPETIRNKTGQLTETEINSLHTHPIMGYQLLTQVAKIKNSLALVALQHQEHFDGTGYPRQIKGDEMVENTKIAAIADSYAALLEPKSYRANKLPYEAMKELITLGVYRYDPVYLKTFLNRLSIYPVGSIVKLSDNTTGLVAGSIENKPMRPIILLLRDPDGTRFAKPVFLHLLFNNSKYILKALDLETSKVNFVPELNEMVPHL